MSKPTKPEPIGSAPCPAAGCGELLEVFKYRERSARGSRFKGKFYARCPTHGSVIEASSPSSQEHVLAKGTIWGNQKPPALPAPTKPAQEPTKPALPVVAQPAPESTPAPTPAPRESTMRRWLQGWNLWDWWPMTRSD